MKHINFTKEQGQSQLLSFDDYELVKPHLALRFLGRTDTRGLLSDYVHRDWLDLKLGYQVFLPYADGHTTSLLVREQQRESWGVTIEALHRDAMENSPRILPPEIFRIDDFIQRLLQETGDPENPDRFAPSDTPPLPLYVATNHAHWLGAACLLYPGITERLSECCGGSFYILPSSIHEMILLPESVSIPPEDLERIVREINQTFTAPTDCLSDHVYLWRQGDILPHRACITH